MLNFIRNKEHNNYIRKYDSSLFNYYFIEDDSNIEIITDDNRNLKENKNIEFKYKQKASLYFKLTGDYDATAFSAYMNIEYFFYNYNNMEYNYVVKIKNSNTGIIIANPNSQEEAQKCFKLLSFSLEK